MQNPIQPELAAAQPKITVNQQNLHQVNPQVKVPPNVKSHNTPSQYAANHKPRNNHQHNPQTTKQTHKQSNPKLNHNTHNPKPTQSTNKPQHPIITKYNQRPTQTTSEESQHNPPINTETSKNILYQPQQTKITSKHKHTQNQPTRKHETNIQHTQKTNNNQPLNQQNPNPKARHLPTKTAA